MGSDINSPRWLPRPLRPAPRELVRAREFTRTVFGQKMQEAYAVPGWLHPDQAAAICYAAQICPEGPIIEIGSFKGKSTLFLAKGMKPTNTLHAIDPHIMTSIGSRHDRAAAERAGSTPSGAETSWTAFNQTLATWGISKSVHPIRSHSHEARAQWDDALAMLWIDGDHEYHAIRQDIEDWVPLVIPGGLCAFHDTHPKHLNGSVRAAIKDSGLLTSGRWRTFLELRNTWVFRLETSTESAQPSPSTS